MTIKVKQVLNKVRELAWAKPEHIYRKVGRGDACSYVGPAVGQPMEPEAGCIMGQAMVACGVSAETLFEIENFKGAMSFGELIPNYGNVLDVERPNHDRGYHAYLLFADNVQQFQDEGKPWGEAYREALSRHLLMRHGYMENSPPSPARCRRCSKREGALEHRGRVQVGDIVEHAESEVLDPRTVVKVVDGMIWLDVPGTEVIGPFPAENYRVIDIDWEVAVDG